MADSETQATVNWKNNNKINGRLPLDSLLQIWARLPLKTLYRFRSVCKFWNFSISFDPLLSNIRHCYFHQNPNFLSHTPPNLLLSLLHTPDEPVKVPDRPIHLSTRPIEDLILSDRDPNLIPIKNGFTPYVDHSLDLLPSKGPLICVASGEYFYLCNPSTQEFLRVEQGRGCHSTSNGAFGYLDLDNKYILTRLHDSGCEFLEFGPGQAGTACWRSIELTYPNPVRGFGLMVKGTFYWTIDCRVINGSTRDFVLYLDTKEEKFGVVPPPEGNENEVILYDHLYLVEFRGSLCAVDNFSRPPRMEIWVMTRFEKEFNWVRKYNIYLSGMDRDLVYPFCDYEGENGGDIVLCNGTRSRLYCYNLKSRSIKQVYKPKHRTNDQLALYTPSPFPLSNSTG